MNAVEWMLAIPQRNSQREFLVDTITGKRLTFARLHERAIAIAARFQELGYSKGDRIAFLLHNSADLAALYFGCLYGGLVAVPINPALTRDDVVYILQHSGAKLIFISEETKSLVDSALIGAMGIALIDDGRVKHDETIASDSVWKIDALPPKPEFVPFQSAAADDIMCIVYTSGTTARPSGVAHRAASMIDNARTFNERLGVGPKNRFYGVLAMTYLGGYYNLLMLPYVGESSVVLSNAFNARSALNFWDPAIDNQVNTLWLVPTIISILLTMDRGQKGVRYCREEVVLGLVGTAPLPTKVRHQFERHYGVSLYENFGLTETFFLTTNSPSLPVLDGSVGRTLPDVQVMILDAKGRPVQLGEEGEIHVRTPYLMEGYYDLKTQQPAALPRNNWFPTGDIGVQSDTGELFITGRKKDLIIRGGVNISPAAIENVLHSHAAVQECAVVGVPNAVNGENVAAMVKLADGVDFEVVRKELLRMSEERLGHIKQPSYILQIDEFPKSVTGKIQKNKVRELAKHKLGLSNLEIYNRFDAVEKSRRPVETMIPGRIRKSFQRPSADLVKSFSEYPTGIISDCLNRMGVMHSAIHSLTPGKSFCGGAFTVEEIEGGNMMSHAALEMIHAGDVLVIGAKGTLTRACWGGLQTLMAASRNVAGIVIDGTVRDLSEIQELQVPVFALGVSAAGPFKNWGGNINCAVACGGVVVSPGDIVRGDDDGVVVIPRQLGERLAACCEARLRLEGSWFDQVRRGASTIDAVGLRQQLASLNFVEETDG